MRQRTRTGTNQGPGVVSGCSMARLLSGVALTRARLATLVAVPVDLPVAPLLQQHLLVNTPTLTAARCAAAVLVLSRCARRGSATDNTDAAIDPKGRGFFHFFAYQLSGGPDWTGRESGIPDGATGQAPCLSSRKPSPRCEGAVPVSAFGHCGPHNVFSFKNTH